MEREVDAMFPLKARAALPLALATGAVLALLIAGCDDNGPDSTPPPIPSGVYSVTGNHAVDVYWNPIQGLEDVGGYGVYRGNASAGPYTKLASLPGASSDHYRDDTVVNGETYYYAIDAFDLTGNESALSVEDVFDTPRPSGDGLRVYASDFDATRSGVDFSAQPSASAMLVGSSEPAADVIVVRGDDGYLRVRGILHGGGQLNYVQDMGGTTDFNDIGFAPVGGWYASSALGFELISGHTYLVWTWDNHFVKFRVTNVTANFVDVDWAYQTDPGNPELIRPRSPAATPGPAVGRS
jgi:hypothetical protein